MSKIENSERLKGGIISVANNFIQKINFKNKLNFNLNGLEAKVNLNFEEITNKI